MGFRIVFDIQTILGFLIPGTLLFLRRKTLFNRKVVGNVTGWLIIIFLLYGRSLYNMFAQGTWGQPINPIPGIITLTDLWVTTILGMIILGLMTYQLFSFMTYKKIYMETLAKMEAQTKKKKVTPDQGPLTEEV